MEPNERERHAGQLTPLLNDLFTIDAYYPHGSRLSFSLSYRFEREKSVKLLEERLRLAGYNFHLKTADDSLLLDIDPRKKLKIPRINVILFFITLFTVYFVPVFLKNLPEAIMGVIPPETTGPLSLWDELSYSFSALPTALDRSLSDLADGAGIEFTLAIISILFVHEMGHFIASRRRGIITSWPYFIPAPNIIGTFGAVIKSKSPFWNRRDLIEVGAAGPITGWLVALFWLFYGLSRSTILPAEAVPATSLAFTLDGESILIRLLAPLLAGLPADNHYYVFTEAAFAGWVGILITAINLLPIGQLDGGHIIYGLLRRKQKYFGWGAMLGLLVLGYQSPMWWFFAAFGFVFGVAHPPTLEDFHPPGNAAGAMGVAALIILMLSFTPRPFQ
ncbi:MAG: site-2 protease family protein [Candidatus Zixiibacteriota bacterium]